MIKIIKVNNYSEMSKKASDFILAQIMNKANSILGLATGGTPEGMYENLIKDHIKNKTDWSNIKSFNLDEYIGIPEKHELSYHTYMYKKLFDKVNINNKNVYIPDGNYDPVKFGRVYDELIGKMGGIDLQILGIGENAHIAFNEPGSSDQDGTREVRLTESTINANARYFESKDRVPKTAITMGIGTILRAKKIILLASGSNKAKAIYDTVNAKISPNVPSSYLQKHHDVTIIVDKEAASKIK